MTKPRLGTDERGKLAICELRTCQECHCVINPTLKSSRRFRPAGARRAARVGSKAGCEFSR